MKNTIKLSYAIIAAIAVSSMILLSNAQISYAFPHASMTLIPDENDPTQANANPIRIVVGHSNEPTFGVSPGVHDGKHNLEIRLSDEATTLPLAGAELTADKFYFSDLASFNAAQSVNDATQVEIAVPVGGIFGSPGDYNARMVQSPGIYGYHIYGTINYFSEAIVPIDATIFCRSDEGPTDKFNVGTWSGGFGCTEKIDDITFPTLVLPTP